VQDSHDHGETFSYPHVGGLNGRVVPVRDVGYRTEKADFSPVDIWLVPVSDVEAEKLNPGSFIEIASKPTGASFTLYLAAGYPFASQRYPGGRNPQTGAVTPRGKMFGSVECWPTSSPGAPEIEDLGQHGYDASANVAVHFDRKAMKRNGQRVQFPFPEGMSGGGLFGFRDWQDPSTCSLAAILTHWLPRPTLAMVGTRVSTVVQLSRQIPKASSEDSSS